ncbi:hypothetical protein [Actinoplanes rectilineatus]|uniref:hypothetical protein n=1 Tax=Actinoplanes rectilineatus TaxID=113571 RepID=UPI0005F29FAC|nr:hypothetical protein [Actinoplanes rectilineatus]
MIVRDLIAEVRRHFATTSDVWQAAERWGELQDAYYDLPCHSPERRRVGEQIAACVDDIAYGIESSRLAATVGFIGDPAGLRRDCSGWRNGDDMSGEEPCEHEEAPL